MKRSGRLALLACACGLAACGGGDEFDADGFVDAMNEGGAELVLGDPLPNSAEGVEIFAIELHEEDEEAESGADPGDEAHTHGGGSLSVTEDEEAGIAEYERCESAATLLCYRAANVVLILESSVPPPEQRAIESAITSLAD